MVQAHALETARLPSSGLFKTGLILAALVVLTTLAVQAQYWFAQYPPTTLSAKPAQAQQEGSDLQAEIITITPRGFEPAEITRPAGRFILMLDNHAELAEVTFRLDQEGGARLYEVPMPQERAEWSEVLDLQPGAYLLTEAAHADWLARITITAP
jgi:hypothetical protein